MAQIKPFKAFFYNQAKFAEFSDLFCPPYDVISSEEQDYYYSLSPYNFIRILLRKDTPKEHKYQKAGITFKEWIKDKVLVQSDKPAVYFYSQEYNVRGEKKTRLGFISLLRLEDKGSAVFGHENTHSPAKEDRLKLLKNTKANLSPIFVVFKDRKRVINRVFDQHILGRPALIEVIDKEKTRHLLWGIDDPGILEFIQNGMRKEDVFIADGHHRYEVSCVYRDKMRKKLQDKFPGESSFNYTLSYFTGADQRGLSILPIHRLLRLDKYVEADELIKSLKKYFDVERIKEKGRFFFLMEKSGFSEHVLGMYKDKKYWFLRLKNIKILDKEMVDKPKEYRSLDAAILNQLIFLKILKIDPQEKERLKFSPNPDGFIEAVDSDPKKVAFFLNPVKIEDIMAVALKGSKMPPKTTYFYPKVLSGMVIHKHEG
ncbi:MAG: DUF1015 domain-containing protein [Candidatus Omnitrophica bacterium]|nr:DUF1015 domain-containing protein [Candidatus Omnitrophota bacterium]